MNFLPLFLKQLRNSRASTLLNLLGLTIALSSFIILIAQVRYELTYDTHFRDADRIFRIEIDVPTELGVYSPLLCRPLGERMLAASPDIEAGGVMAIPRRATYKPVHADADMEDLLDRAINQNYVPVVDDQGYFIGIITCKEIIKYCYKEMKELSILRKKEEADS